MIGGYYIFINNGLYYIVYNNSNSYPSGMGKEILLQLCDLVKKHHGDVKLACRYWGSLLLKLKIEVVRADVVDPERTENNEIDINLVYKGKHQFGGGDGGYLDIEKGLHDTDNEVHLCDMPKLNSYEEYCENTPLCGCVDYIYEIDLDRGEFRLIPYGNLSMQIAWSLKSVHRNLLSSTTRWQRVATWENDCESFDLVSADIFSRLSPTNKTNFKRMYCAIAIQTCARGYLARKHSLNSGGVLHEWSLLRMKTVQHANILVVPQRGEIVSGTTSGVVDRGGDANISSDSAVDVASADLLVQTTDNLPHSQGELTILGSSDGQVKVDINNGDVSAPFVPTTPGAVSDNKLFKDPEYHRNKKPWYSCLFAWC